MSKYIYWVKKKNLFGLFQNQRRYVNKDNATILNKGGGIEMSTTVLFHIRDARSLRLKYIPSIISTTMTTIVCVLHVVHGYCIGSSRSGRSCSSTVRRRSSIFVVVTASWLKKHGSGRWLLQQQRKQRSSIFVSHSCIHEIGSERNALQA